MLTKIVATQGANAPSKRQITLNFATTTGTVLYTVPAGKTCTGNFIGRPGQNGSASINNQVFWMTASSLAATAALPVVLTEGTVLRAQGASGECSFIGVEE